MEDVGSTSYWIVAGFSLGVISTLGIRRLPSVVHFVKDTSQLIFYNRKVKLVLVARSNIMMSKGKVASQCAHAAVCCYKEAQMKHPGVVNMWLLLGQPKVVLKIDDLEENVLKLAEKAKKSGLTCTLIRDAGRTQVETGTLTVVGIGPGFCESIDKITGHLKLM